MTASENRVSKLIKKYVEMGSLGRHPGSGRPTKITPALLMIMEDHMQRDDETTAIQLQRILLDHGHLLSLRTILQSRLPEAWLDVQGECILPDNS